MITTTDKIRLFHITFKTEYGLTETWPIYDVSLASAINHIHALNNVAVTVIRADDPELRINSQ